MDRSQSGDTLGDSNYENLLGVMTAFNCTNEPVIKLEAIIDKSSVEAFFFGWYSMTNLVFTDDSNKGIELWVSDPEKVQVKEVKIKVLEKSMFPEQK